ATAAQIPPLARFIPRGRAQRDGKLLRGERIYQAHRSHAYQWLARRWGSHAKVTCAVLIVDVLWLLPCAVFAARRPGLAAATVIVAFTPLVLLAMATSGRREANDRTHR